MADRRDAVGLHLVEHHDELVPGLGRLAAGRVEGLLVDPDPVGRVDVHRRGDPLAVILREGLQRGRDDGIPVFLRGDFAEIADDALLGPVGDVEAERLHGSRRVAGGDAGAQRGHRRLAAAAGDGHVLPGDALGLEVLLQNVERRSLAAGRPPVQDFDFVREGRSRIADGQRRRKHGSDKQFAQHDTTSQSCGYTTGGHPPGSSQLSRPTNRCAGRDETGWSSPRYSPPRRASRARVQGRTACILRTAVRDNRP